MEAVARQTTAGAGPANTEARLPKVRRWKTFAGEYVMIVLSIMTALALENGVRQWHQAREAQEAARNLDAEIAVNLAEMRSVIAHNDAEIQRIRRLREILLKDIKAGVGDKEAIKNVMIASNMRFDLNIHSPSLQREAWDVAVANQALSFMPQEQLLRYAKQYASMRDIQTLLVGSGNSFMDMPQLSNTMSNLQLNDITARDLYRTLTQMSFVHESNGGNMRQLEQLLAGGQKRAPAKG